MVRNNIGQSLELIFMRFIARASESSGLQGYWLTFFVFTQGLQKILTNSPHLLCIRNSPFWMSILKSLSKNRKKWADNTEAMRILNRFQKKHDNRFKTLSYVCSEPQKNSKTVFLCFLKSVGKNRKIFFLNHFVLPFYT